MHYWIISAVLVNVWTIYAAVISRADSGSPAFTCWVVVNMQTFLLFNFWRSRVLAAEEYLVTLSNFVERAPTAAKALIETADVIRERDLARAVLAVHYRLLQYDVTQGLEQGDSLLDLRQLRRTKRISYGHRVHASKEDESMQLRKVLKQAKAEAGEGARPRTVLAAVFAQMRPFVERALFEKLYGLIFVFLIVMRRVRSKRMHVFPFRNDIPCFVALAGTSLLCMLLVLGVEVYSLYLGFWANGGASELLFGSTNCRTCYSRLYRSGRSCQASSACFPEPVRTGFCLLQSLLSGVYGLGRQQVLALAQDDCPGRVNGTLPQLF